MDKNTIRRQMKNIRKLMNSDCKKIYDEMIFRKLISSHQYKNHNVILCYVSSAIEVDTRKFINHALDDGKIIAVPKCMGSGSMTFFEISSLECLERSAFGIDEPSALLSRPVEDSEINSALCIVPALSYDRSGGRVGYGGGYYDRFLSVYNPETLGICYSLCISEKIESFGHDIKIKNIITENEYIGGY